MSRTSEHDKKRNFYLEDPQREKIDRDSKFIYYYEKLVKHAERVFRRLVGPRSVSVDGSKFEILCSSMLLFMVVRCKLNENYD